MGWLMDNGLISHVTIICIKSRQFMDENIIKRKKVFETDNVAELIEVEKVFKNLDIEFVVRTKTSNILNNFLNLFLYQVLTFGVERKNEVMRLYVAEKDFNYAMQVIKEIKLPILR